MYICMCIHIYLYICTYYDRFSFAQQRSSCDTYTFKYRLYLQSSLCHAIMNDDD